MSSFYGGKQGRTYHIVKTYKDIQLMCTNFRLGGSYTDVNYGEYVLISTNRINNPLNGYLYRREFDYDNTPASTSYENPGAGAKYIGRIVGPQGPAPQINVIDTSVSPASTETDSVITVNSTITNDNYGNVEGANLSFKFPYPIFDFNIIEPSSTISTNSTFWNGYIKHNNNSKNFYHVYDLGIPYVSSIDYTPASSNGNSFTPSKINFTISNIFEGNGVLKKTTKSFIYNNIESIETETGRKLIKDDEKNYYEVGDLFKFKDSLYAICLISNPNESKTNTEDILRTKSNVVPGTILRLEDDQQWQVINLNENPVSKILIKETGKAEKTDISLKNIDFLFTNEKRELFVRYIDGNSLKISDLPIVNSQFHVLGEVNVEDLLESGIYKNGLQGIYEGWLVTYLTEDTLPGKYIKHIMAYDTLGARDENPHQIDIGGGQTGTSYWYEIMDIATEASEKDPSYVFTVNDTPPLFGFSFMLSNSHYESHDQ